MSYLNSTDISIFPIGDRTNDKAEDRLLSEKNLTNVFKGLTSKDSYVLSYENSTRKCKFVLCGYYIEATIDANLLPTDTNPYLYTVLNFSAGTNNLVGDAGDKFQGVEFTTTEPQSNNHSLSLLTYTTSDGVVIPESSMFKYSGDSIYIADGGVDKSINEYLSDKLDDIQDTVLNKIKWKQYPTT